MLAPDLESFSHLVQVLVHFSFSIATTPAGDGETTRTAKLAVSGPEDPVPVDREIGEDADLGDASADAWIGSPKRRDSARR